jgi:hypothetical protein
MSDVKDKAKDAIDTAAKNAKKATDKVAEKASEAAKYVGQAVKHAGDKIKEMASKPRGLLGARHGAPASTHLRRSVKPCRGRGWTHTTTKGRRVRLRRPRTAFPQAIRPRADLGHRDSL